MPTRRDVLANLSATSALTACGVSRVAYTPANAAAPSTGPVASYGIYPPIGMARVGNSDDWFLAPEVPGVPPLPAGDYKNGADEIKRQAQRFRVYAFDAAGQVVREVTAAEADITWTVRLANTKAAWYGFSNPMDNEEAAPGIPGQRRNGDIMGADREAMLVIDSGEVSIQGVDVNPTGSDAAFELTGTFWGTMPVYLGEVRTDGAGRLIVLGGRGVTQSALPDNPIDNFSDNDGWHDDWSDGPVTATLRFADGTEVVVQEPAWLACCGPNFAPDIEPIVTLYDVMENLAIDEGWRQPPVRLSFQRDIYPFFQRLGLMAWVAAEANLRQGWIDVGDFLDPAYMGRVADARPANQAFRQSLFDKIRPPNVATVEPDMLPRMLGDGINYQDSPLRWFTITPAWYDVLMRWAAGDFIDDWRPNVQPAITELSQVPLTEQPAALTRAALDPCSGGAFHPGVELTWPLRHRELFTGPFRLAHSNRASLIQDVGRLLTPQIALTQGPVGPVSAGDLTRWMGLPWQCDAFSCQSVTFSNGFPVAVWWPALLPIDVLPEAYYDQLMRTDLTPAERLKFFESRLAWSRGSAGIGYHAEASYNDGLNKMIYLWNRMGMIVQRPGPTDRGAPRDIPDTLFVEIDRGSMSFIP